MQPYNDQNDLFGDIDISGGQQEAYRQGLSDGRGTSTSARVAGGRPKEDQGISNVDSTIALQNRQELREIARLATLEGEAVGDLLGLLMGVVEGRGLAWYHSHAVVAVAATSSMSAASTSHTAADEDDAEDRNKREAAPTYSCIPSTTDDDCRRMLDILKKESEQDGERTKEGLDYQEYCQLLLLRRRIRIIEDILDECHGFPQEGGTALPTDTGCGGGGGGGDPFGNDPFSSAVLVPSVRGIISGTEGPTDPRDDDDVQHDDNDGTGTQQRQQLGLFDITTQRMSADVCRHYLFDEIASLCKVLEGIIIVASTSEERARKRRDNMDNKSGKLLNNRRGGAKKRTPGSTMGSRNETAFSAAVPLRSSNKRGGVEGGEETSPIDKEVQRTEGPGERSGGCCKNDQTTETETCCMSTGSSSRTDSAAVSGGGCCGGGTAAGATTVTHVNKIAEVRPRSISQNPPVPMTRIWWRLETSSSEDLELDSMLKLQEEDDSSTGHHLHLRLRPPTQLPPPVTLAQQQHVLDSFEQFYQINDEKKQTQAANEDISSW